MGNQAKGITLAVTAAFMWGIMSVFVRRLSGAGYGSADISFLRCLLAGSVYLIFVAIQNPRALRVDGRGLLICLGYGAAAYSMSFMSYSIAVSRIPVAAATVLMFMSPIWVTLISVLVFHEKVGWKKIAAILLCLVGAAMTANLMGAGGGMDALGILAGVLNGFGVALQIMIPRYFSRRLDRDTMLVYGFLGAAAVLLFFTSPGTIASSLASDDRWMILASIAGIGILCTMVANVAYVKSTAYVSATTTSILSALEVVVGSAVGFLVFHEQMMPVQILGAVIIVAASLGSELMSAKDP